MEYSKLFTNFAADIQIWFMTIFLEPTDKDEEKSLARVYESWGKAKVVECDAILQLPTVDARVQAAIQCLEKEGTIKRKYDHAWIMRFVDEGKIKGLSPFYSEGCYIRYMNELGIKGVAGISTLNQYYNTVEGEYPNWTFTDTNDNGERIRRVNVVRRFLTVFLRGG